MGTVTKNLEMLIDGDEGSHLGHTTSPTSFFQKVRHSILYEFYKNKVTQKPNRDTRAGSFTTQASPALRAWREAVHARPRRPA